MTEFINNTAEQLAVNVVDAPMGCGKTSAAIRYINEMPSDERVIFVSPYVAEGERIQGACPSKRIICLDDEKYKTKLNDLRVQVRRNGNVASTHALLGRYTPDILEMIQAQNYTLIIDEAYSVLRSLDRQDINTIRYMMAHEDVAVNQVTGRVYFTSPEAAELASKLYKELAGFIDSGTVYSYGKKVLAWLFPIDILKAFKCIVVLTYMFDAHPFYYYLKIHEAVVNTLGVRQVPDGRYQFCRPEESDGFCYNVKEKLHILDDVCYNKVGDGEYGLSKAKCKKSLDGDKVDITRLARRIRGVYRYRFGCSVQDYIWTCFKDYESLIEDKNIKKRYVPCNQRAVNKWGNVHYMTYAVGRFPKPDAYNYFLRYGYKMDTERWALSEIVQWVWRSAIRNGEEVWLYIPSEPMRNLLLKWIDEVSAPFENKGVTE